MDKCQTVIDVDKEEKQIAETVRKMKSPIEQEFAEFDSKGSWKNVFDQAAVDTPVHEDVSTREAQAPNNQHKNRYKDVSPYDHSRVKLSGSSDYINASLVLVEEAGRRYILTQGPLEHTVADFWQMAWEQGSKAVIMLNRLVERGQLKCSQYWPVHDPGARKQEMTFEEHSLKVRLLKELEQHNFTLRFLELQNIKSGDQRQVLHFHYTTWPDFGVPSSPDSFLHFLSCVRESNSLAPDSGPAIVHCSAGIGRSGTFCLVDSCLVMVENKKSLNCVNVKKTLAHMRSYRMGLIQTPDQLRFSYQAIIEGGQAILSGKGLKSFLADHRQPDQSHNHTDVQPPPQPPERTDSLKLSGGQPQEGASTSQEDNLTVQPRESDPQLLAANSGQESLGQDLAVDQGSQESSRDNMMVGSEADDGGGDVENELRAAELRHQIREERKKKTLEKIQQMKEKQRQCERWRPYQSYLRHSKYVGLALLVAVAALVYQFWV